MFASSLPSTFSRLFSLLLFKLCWLLCVVGQGRWDWAVALLLPLLALCLLPVIKQQPQLLWCCAFFAGVGLLNDSVLQQLGLLQFSSPWLPRWLVLLWIAFALSMPPLDYWLRQWSLWWLAALGAAGGASSYLAGQALGAVHFGFSKAISVGVIGVCWALLLPWWRLLTNRFVRGRWLQTVLLLCGVALQPDAKANEAWPVLGSGEYQRLLVSIYTATLQTPATDFHFPVTTPFALTLRYHHRVNAERIVQATLQQWQQQHLSVPPAWSALLEQSIPAIAKGDELTLHVPSWQQATLLHNGNAIYNYTDIEFVRAFAGIWLDPRTTEPALRAQLLGEDL